MPEWPGKILANTVVAPHFGQGGCEIWNMSFALKQAGARHSQSPVFAEKGAVMQRACAPGPGSCWSILLIHENFTNGEFACARWQAPPEGNLRQRATQNNASARPPRGLSGLSSPSRRKSVPQNWNGSTETDSLLSDDRWMVKLTSFCAFVSPTVADMEPLHFSVRLSSLVDVVIIFSPRTYNGCSASEAASLDLARFELLAANLTKGLLWSSETFLSTAFRVSKESHSGLASQPTRKIRTTKLQKTTDRVRKFGIMPSVVETSSGNRFEAALFQGKKPASRK
jgi:hypothetical protein